MDSRQDFNRVIAKLKKGEPPTDEDREVVRLAFAELGEVFESMRLHAEAALEGIRIVWASYVNALPDEYVDTLNRQIVEKNKFLLEDDDDDSR